MNRCLSTRSVDLLRQSAKKLSASAHEASCTVESTSTHINISRLKPRHRVIINGGVPPVEFDWEKSRAAERERFGQYGLKSNVDIGKLWPSVEEVEEQYALGLFREYNDVVNELKMLTTEKEKKRVQRLAELEKKEAKYPDLLAKYKASLIKAEKEKDEKELVLERRIREIQEYFGYWMDPKDPRFEVMLQQKEAEEKKAEKMAKRLELQKKKIAEIV